ncbi:uncharacterized protein TM35_000162450 [Trypanosoma theileri]|uniref:Cilium assembly protein DZIP1 N-terminal domain-containing protein n=1 Tax=Trypanosoma theileri TaxID=67003 RepID=A0A1X0NV80_9TRYP|nr:uncharacterized protein TM35_000162450 [Trypanosoma theileri]ORC88607.1 hypothetical protein TM35_000162450 [Trypanosoma theileri]
MSVAERLRSFRYVTSTREIPWTHLRSIDVPSNRVNEPDLHLMKNVISLVSDCNLATATAPTTSSADVYQLLSVLQLALQFTLWSQSILKEQLVEKQNSITVKQVNSQLLDTLEAKLEASRREAVKLREERDTFEVTCRTLEHRLTQCETTIRCLEKNLVFEQKRLQESLKYISTQEMKHQEQQRQEGQQKNVEKLNPPLQNLPHTRGECLPDEGYGDHSHSLHAKHHKRHSRQCCLLNSDTSDSTSFSSHVAEVPPRRGKNHRREDLSALLRHLRQEEKGAEQVQRQEQEQPLQQQKEQSSPPYGDSSITLVGEKIEDDVINTFRREMEELQSRTTATCDAMRETLENAVTNNLQRTEAMIRRVEESVENLKASLVKEQAGELQSVKSFLTQWQTDTRAALEASVVTMINQIKTEYAQEKEREQEKQNQQQQQQQSLIPSFSTIPPVLTISQDVIKESTCQHCRQRIPVKQLDAHEEECELRLVKCPQCGNSVVARLLSKHKCSGGTTSETGTPESATLLRASSLMLQETQRELQQLLEENSEEASSYETPV